MIRACKHGHTDLKCTNPDQDIYFCKACGTTLQFYYTMALGLPSWLTQQRGEVPAQLKIRKTVGEIVDGHHCCNGPESQQPLLDAIRVAMDAAADVIPPFGTGPKQFWRNPR